MKYYFTLQYKRLYRLIQENGMNPSMVYISVVFLFGLLSEQLFQRIEYAGYIYPLVALGLINELGSKERNDFLKSCYSVSDFIKIRIIENLVIVVPFFVFLLFKQQYLIAFSVCFIAAMLSFLNKFNRERIKIPTPFGNNPFEFIVGFRKSYLVILSAYLLTFVAIGVNNYYLGIFALIIIFLVCLNFYTKPEPVFYVWIHSDNEGAFLMNKFKIAFSYSSLLSLPIIITLFLFYTENAHIILGTYVFGILIVTTSLFGKYAYFPSEINLIPSFLIAFCIFFPPLLFLIIPYFYFQSKKNLRSILK